VTALYTPAAQPRQASELTHTTPDLADHAAEIRRLIGQMRFDAVEIGRHLTECRDSIGHGDWARWLKEEFGWTPRHALNFMNAYEFVRSKSEIISDLKIPATAVFLLAAPSTPPEAVVEIVEQAKRDGKVKVADAKKTIEKHKAKANGATSLAIQEITPIDEHRAKMAALDQPAAEPIAAPAAVAPVTEPDDGALDFAKFKQQLAELAENVKRLTPAQAREVVDLATTMQGDICDIVDADKKRKRCTKEAKNPQKTLDDARKEEQRDESEYERAEAKKEARESGEEWSGLKDEWERDWLLDNWDEKREQDFLNNYKTEWHDRHGQEFPGSNFAPAKKGGAK